jgi:hypothetical protein
MTETRVNVRLVRSAAMFIHNNCMRASFAGFG